MEPLSSKNKCFFEWQKKLEIVMRPGTTKIEVAAATTTTTTTATTATTTTTTTTATTTTVTTTTTCVSVYLTRCVA